MTARVADEKDLKRAGVEKYLMKRVRRRQLSLLGRIVRAEELESDCLFGEIDEKRPRGRQRTKYMDNILAF